VEYTVMTDPIDQLGDVDLLVDVIRELGASLHGGDVSRVAASGGAGRSAPSGGVASLRG
jgi:hypothetical protein